MTMRHQILLLTFCVICLIALNVHAANSVTAKNHGVVSHDMVRLSDLFTGVNEATDTPVTAAPAPGKSLTFSADVLTLLAKRYGLLWMPVKTGEHVVIKRSSLEITSADVLNALVHALNNTDAGENLDVELDTRLKSIHLAPTASPMLAVSQLKFDRATRRFSALVSTVDGQEYPLTGRAYNLIKVPVLNRRISHGEIIRSGDIGYVEYRESTLARNLITNPSMLIGKTPRRFTAQGKALRADAVTEPVLVKKGKSVLVVLQTDSMTLTIRGKATENGAMGDIIRVMNTKSNQMIDGEVVGSGRVRVAASPQTTAMKLN